VGGLVSPREPADWVNDLVAICAGSGLNGPLGVCSGCNGSSDPGGKAGRKPNPLILGKNVESCLKPFLDNVVTNQTHPWMEGVRTGKCKHMSHLNRKMTAASIHTEFPVHEELFDLENDPEELRTGLSGPDNACIGDTLR
jgi:hypothetical protein